MSKFFEKLLEDVRFKEGLNACINCGTCTAICPAAEFYNYDPRQIVDIVQTRDDSQIESLLKSETIWYCGECMSCKTRCPRNNTPGLIIIALRSLSQDLGYFVESEKGRQQLALKRTIGEWMVRYGYCLYLEGVGTDLHPEQGPIWDWRQKNWSVLINRLGGNYGGKGPGILRKIPDEAIEELNKIFEVTGAFSRYNKIEEYSKSKALEMGLEFDETNDNEYFNYIYNVISDNHSRE